MSVWEIMNRGRNVHKHEAWWRFWETRGDIRDLCGIDVSNFCPP